MLETMNTFTKQVIKRGGTAALAAIVINIILLQIVLQAGLVDPFMPVATGPIVTFTLLGVIGATAVYWYLGTNRDDHDAAFTKIAGIVLLLSFIPDIGLLVADPTATVSGAIFLMVLHVTTAAICVRALTGTIGIKTIQP